MKLYKYHGAGNDFLLIDGFTAAGPAVLPDPELVVRLCDRHFGLGADGLMLLLPSAEADFRMMFWNPDGSCGMMCGNGGRCIAAFAADLALKAGGAEPGHFLFEAPDGLHTAEILSGGPARLVRLGMRDVDSVQKLSEDEFFLDTGTRHLVKFVPDVDAVDLRKEGPALRYDSRFAPAGVNVDFVCREADGLRVRTYEKGVEDETLACGTGIVASALASFAQVGASAEGGHSVSVPVAARGGRLVVDFVPSAGISSEGSRYSGIYLTGPAVKVAEIFI